MSKRNEGSSLVTNGKIRSKAATDAYRNNSFWDKVKADKEKELECGKCGAVGIDVRKDCHCE